MKLRTGLLMVVMLVAGCSSGSKARTAPSMTAPAAVAPTTVTTTTVRTTVAPTTLPPKPVIWSQKKAAAEYLSMVAPENKLVKHINTYAVRHNIRQYTATAGKMAKAEDVFARNLHAGLWPVSARADVRRLFSAVLAERSALLDIAKAKSFSDANAVDLPTGSASAATAVRIDLGLPSGE